MLRNIRFLERPAQKLRNVDTKASEEFPESTKLKYVGKSRQVFNPG